MSYILEALQKSEHARHRGKVPDLNTLPETTPNVAGHAASSRPPYLAAGFALALAAAVLGWWRPWQAPQPKQEVPAQASQTATSTVPPAPPAVAPVAAPPVAPLAATAPAAQAALEPLAPVRPPAATPEPARTVAPIATTRREPPAAESAPIRRSESSPRKAVESAPTSPTPTNDRARATQTKRSP